MHVQKNIWESNIGPINLLKHNGKNEEGIRPSSFLLVQCLQFPFDCLEMCIEWNDMFIPLKCIIVRA